MALANLRQFLIEDSTPNTLLMTSMDLTDQLGLPTARRADVVDAVRQLFPNVRISQLNGNRNGIVARANFHGLRVRTAEETLENAQILLFCGTDVELAHVRQAVNDDRDVYCNNIDVGRLVVGFSKQKHRAVVICKVAFKDAFRAFGATRHLLPQCPEAGLVAKVGHCATATLEAGSISVLRPGNMDHQGRLQVFFDKYNDEVLNETAYFPSQSAIQASHAYPGPLHVRRGMAQCGPKLVTEAQEALLPHDQESAGIIKAVQTELRPIESTIIEVVSDTLGNEQIMGHTSVTAALGNLQTFLEFFLDAVNLP